MYIGVFNDTVNVRFDDGTKTTFQLSAITNDQMHLALGIGVKTILSDIAALGRAKREDDAAIADRVRDRIAQLTGANT